MFRKQWTEDARRICIWKMLEGGYSTVLTFHQLTQGNPKQLFLCTWNCTKSTAYVAPVRGTDQGHSNENHMSINGCACDAQQDTCFVLAPFIRRQKRIFTELGLDEKKLFLLRVFLAMHKYVSSTEHVHSVLIKAASPLYRTAGVIKYSSISLGVVDLNEIGLHQRVNF